MQTNRTLKNFLSLLGLLLLAALLQNCSLEKSGSSTLSSLDYKELTAPNCPFYRAPKCIGGSTLVQVENENGCKYKVCQKEQKLVSCPRQALPMCKPHEKTLETKDSNGCYYAKCTLKNTNLEKNFSLNLTEKIGEVKSKTSITCKNKHVTCSKNEVLSTDIDENRCLKKTCKARKPFYCPLKESLRCSHNEVTYNSFNEKGCASLVCKNKGLMACPNKLIKRCSFNETTKLSVDEKGCKKITCHKKVKIASLCKLKRPPRCSLGQTLAIRINQKGCSSPYCRSY